MSEQNTTPDQDIKDSSNLLNNSDNTQDLVDKAQIVTEVTSLAKEEAKTGQKVQMPSAEELVARATSSYHRNITMLTNLVKARNGGSYQISRKGMNRVMSAIIQMPTDGMPVGLQGDEEKMAFTLGQRVLMDRYIITHHHIVQEQKRVNEERKAAAEAAAAAPPVTEEVKTEEGNTNV